MVPDRLVIFLIIGVLCQTSTAASIFDTALYHNITAFFLDALRDDSFNQSDLANSQPDKSIMDDASLLSPQLIEKYGYPSETHVVTTLDGYILEMHRIPKKGAPVVLLMHGILDTSATWILMGPNFGLGYLLSGLGYDVWMGNARGNRYSRKHVTLENEDKKFWDFSFHEMGVYDLPKMIDHILEETNQEKIHYIGHSQGTSMFWVMCSEKPQYVTRILSMHALAPVAYLSDMWNPFVKTLTIAMDFLDAATSFLNINEFLPNTEIMVHSAQKVCHDKAITQEVCSNVLFLIAGFNSQQMNKTMLPVILGHTPSGASAKQFIHFGQLIRSGTFRKYNYGFLKNFEEYGKLIPPDYNLHEITVPVALYFANNDWLVSKSSVERIARELPNVYDAYLVNDPNFNHLDFLWAVDGKKLLYSRVLENMRKMEM